MRTTQATINAFFGQDAVAVFGASRSGKKFGNVVYRHLKEQGIRVYAVHPEVAEIEGDRAYPDLETLPEQVDAAVLVIPPARAEQAVKDCVMRGIGHIWLQPGAESEAAIRYCEDHGVHPVHGYCLMMFAEPVRSIHRFHRTLWRWFGKMPATGEA